METLHPKIELDIQSFPEGRFEATSNSMEGFIAQSTSILDAIEQALLAASDAPLK